MSYTLWMEKNLMTLSLESQIYFMIYIFICSGGIYHNKLKSYYKYMSPFSSLSLVYIHFIIKV